MPDYLRMELNEVEAMIASTEEMSLQARAWLKEADTMLRELKARRDQILLARMMEGEQ